MCTHHWSHTTTQVEARHSQKAREFVREKEIVIFARISNTWIMMLEGILFVVFFSLFVCLVCLLDILPFVGWVSVVFSVLGDATARPHTFCARKRFHVSVGGRRLLVCVCVCGCYLSILRALYIYVYIATDKMFLIAFFGRSDDARALAVISQSV